MILMIDNYDSFTYNIVQVLGGLGVEVLTRRNDRITLPEVAALAPRAIVISPGPGRPEEAGVTCPLIARFAGQIPILGVCLGHQALARALGGRVVRARVPVHGKTSEIFHDGQGLYLGLRNPFPAARYHSLVVPEEGLPPGFRVAAYTLAGEVMGLSCPARRLEGVQFHPESIATQAGPAIFRNFLDQYLN